MLTRTVAARDFGVRAQVWPDRSGWRVQSLAGRLLALDWSLEDLAIFDLPNDAIGFHGVSPDGANAVVSAQARVVVVDSAGREAWQYRHPSWRCGGSERGSCAFSANGQHVWAHVPRETGSDEWIVLDSQTGALIARAPLECYSAGSSNLFHPDGVHIGLSVGEGQDGSESYWGRLEDGDIVVRRLADTTRILVDIAPDGGSFLTTPHGYGPVRLHQFPSGDVLASFGPGDRLGDEDSLDMFGGFLDPQTIVFTSIERDDLFVASVDDPDAWEEVRVPSPRAGQALLVASGLCLSTDWPEGHVEVWKLE